MGVESATTISGLDPLAPGEQDSTTQGNDHLQLIKDVLQKQFPGGGGVGFDEPITATEEDINSLEGVIGGYRSPNKTMKAELDLLHASNEGSVYNLNAPVGTRLLFAQATPPAGWETDATSTAHHGMTVTIGATLYTDGNTDIRQGFTHYHTMQDTVLTVAQMPRHVHSLWYKSTQPGDISGYGIGWIFAAPPSTDGHWAMKIVSAELAEQPGHHDIHSPPPMEALGNTDWKGGDGNGTVDGHNHVVDPTTWRPKYIQVIEAVRVDPEA